MVRIHITDADYQRALHRFTLLDWKRVKTEARCQAAQRMLDENAAATKRAIDEQQAVLGRAHTIDEFLGSSDRVDALFREHEELLDIAFPRAKEKR